MIRQAIQVRMDVVAAAGRGQGDPDQPSSSGDRSSLLVELGLGAPIKVGVFQQCPATLVSQGIDAARDALKPAIVVIAEDAQGFCPRALATKFGC